MSFYPRHVEREILSALIDGELDAAQRREVHEHLQECTACREAMDEFSHVHGLVGELPRLIAPESFVSVALRPPRASLARTTASSLLAGRRKWAAAGIVGAALAITLGGLATPAPAEQPPVGAFIDRHVSVHSGIENTGHVLFAVNGP